MGTPDRGISVSATAAVAASRPAARVVMTLVLVLCGAETGFADAFPVVTMVFVTLPGGGASAMGRATCCSAVVAVAVRVLLVAAPAVQAVGAMLLPHEVPWLAAGSVVELVACSEVELADGRPRVVATWQEWMTFDPEDMEAEQLIGRPSKSRLQGGGRLWGARARRARP
mmetsp:Transcript_23754/g.70889  ORF Transcript_23754/g.70889 Transcript_23754/m.70889 type:complete len:170 (+) Transcript_23754:1020-1529(+)